MPIRIQNNYSTSKRSHAYRADGAVRSGVKPDLMSSRCETMSNYNYKATSPSRWMEGRSALAPLAGAGSPTGRNHPVPS
jgi:hypothetical protein